MVGSTQFSFPEVSTVRSARERERTQLVQRLRMVDTRLRDSLGMLSLVGEDGAVVSLDMSVQIWVWCEALPMVEWFDEIWLGGPQDPQAPGTDTVGSIQILSLSFSVGGFGT